jgi:hypothetical protein
MAPIFAWLTSVEIRGRVLQPPHHEFLGSRQMARGSRSLPRTSLRLEAEDGRVWTVTYTGEMDGQVTQGDSVAAFGYRRGSGNLTATEIWLVGQVGPDGQGHDVDPAVRVAKKRTLT